MLKYRFADLNIEASSDFDDYFQFLYKEYLTDFKMPDMVLKMNSDDILRERKLSTDFDESQIDYCFAPTAFLRKVGEALPSYDGVVLHAATFSVDGRGIAFGAFSGTGKTTHMNLWKEMLGERFQIVNGDKPFARFIDDKLYVYGNPWAGKENLQANIKVPLTDICQIVRSETNYTEPMSKEEGALLLIKQIYMPFDPVAKIKTLKLINRITESVSFWKIHCNMEKEAAKVSYNTIFGDNL